MSLPIIGKEDDYKRAETAFYKDVQLKETFFTRRLDVKNHKQSRFTGRKIGA